MPTSLFQYEMLPTTWFYVSSLMLIATFFRFNRFFSIRNLDIVGIILFTPGLLYLAMVTNPNDPRAFIAYLWLTILGFMAFMRMAFDCFMVRRPLLEPNLNSWSVWFACIMLMCFLVANLFVNRGDKVTSTSILRLEQIQTMRNEYFNPEMSMARPGYPPFLRLTRMMNNYQAPPQSFWKNTVLTKSDYVGSGVTTATVRPSIKPIHNTLPLTPPHEESLQEGDFLLCCAFSVQLAIALGMIFIGHLHFGNIKTGVAASMFYLLLPYVSQMPSVFDHTVPGLLILYAVLFYRRPVFSGLLIGLAGSLVFYPFFLIPLWCGFYYRRGLLRFLMGSLSAVLAMGVLLLLSPDTLGTYTEQISMMFGKYSMRVPVYDGLWLFCPTIYRIPIIAFFGVFCFGLMLWPTRKNLATVISCSALLMLGVQFWMGQHGGLYGAWYLPLLILTVFRPNLEDRVATSTVVEVYT